MIFLIDFQYLRYYNTIVIICKMYVIYVLHINLIYQEITMYINYDYYRIFYYVATYQNISQAAKELLSNQPNLTRTIKKLEDELGCPLFLRSRKGMKLTPEGERLYEHIRIAIEHIDAGESEITESRNLQNGTVYIAASEVALRCLLLPVLKKYRLLYPGIHIRVSNHSTPQAIEALRCGSADIAVVTTPTVHAASLVETNVKPIKEVAVCSPYFSNLSGRRIALSELTKFPLISLGKDTKSFEFYSALFTTHGLTYKPDIEAFTADQILPMVEADLGIGFVPEEFLRNENGVFKIDLKETIPDRNIVLIKRKEQPLSVAAKELERMILENVEENN